MAEVRGKFNFNQILLSVAVGKASVDAQGLIESDYCHLTSEEGMRYRPFYSAQVRRMKQRCNGLLAR